MGYEYLVHYGILGQKWGIRRYQNEDGTLTEAGKKRYITDSEGNLVKKPSHRSNSISAMIARKKNENVDKGFKDWEENNKKKEKAISLGKDMNKAKIDYENNRSNKELEDSYKKLNSEYKKELRENTTFRKGVVRQEVGRDLARKYLSNAKLIQKQLMKDSSNKNLQSKYNDLMSKHDIERAKARKAADVGASRSSKIASLKRARTVAVKGTVAAGAIAGGTIITNSILKKNGYSGITSETVSKAVQFGKKLFGASKYVY